MKLQILKVSFLNSDRGVPLDVRQNLQNINMHHRRSLDISFHTPSNPVDRWRENDI